jgi:mono/diheme cytochrome c family protein
MRQFPGFVLAVSFAVVALAAAPAYADAALIALGRAIAAKNCGRCHAIGRIGASANPKSPPFRALSRRYPIVDLEEALGEGIMVGHEGLEMPHFQLSPGQIGAMMAYLKSVQRK